MGLPIQSEEVETLSASLIFRLQLLQVQVRQVTVLQEPLQLPGLTLTFTPPQAVPVSPGSLTFSSVSTNSMVVGWTDNSLLETNFSVFVSTDNITFTRAATLTSTTTATTGTLYSTTLTGLAPSTLYYVQVISHTEGVPSAPLSGSQTTNSLVPICGSFTVSNLLTTDIGLMQFASLGDAAAYISANGICGALTLNVAAGHTETAPAGGIKFSLCAIPSGNAPSASQPIIIQKSGAGANPLITAFTPGVSTTVDGIFILEGVDYVTIDGIDLQENAANTTPTTQMEWGYALLKCSGNDGANNNTIKNCVVTLNKANTASCGIYSGNHTSASISGLTYSGVAGTEDASRNGSNTFYGNTLTNVYNGFWLVGNSSSSPNGNGVSLNDTLNQVGVTGQARNIITNFGGLSSTAYGINLGNQRGIICSNDSINGGAGGTGSTYGINAPSGVWGTFNDNRVTISSNSTSSTNYGMYLTYSGGDATNPNIFTTNNNIVSGCTFPLGTSGSFYGIYTSGGGTNSVTNMMNNQVINNTLCPTGTLYLFGGGAGTTQNITGNTVSGNTRRVSTPGGTMYCMYMSGTASAGSVSGNTVSNNTVTGLSGSSTATIYGLYSSNSTVGVTYGGNTITGLTASGTSTGSSTIYSMYFSTGTAGNTVSGNFINNNSTGTGQNGSVYGIYNSSGNNNMIANKICGLSSGGSTTAIVKGMQLSSGTMSAYNNIITNLQLLLPRRQVQLSTSLVLMLRQVRPSALISIRFV